MSNSILTDCIASIIDCARKRAIAERCGGIAHAVIQPGAHADLAIEQLRRLIAEDDARRIRAESARQGIATNSDFCDVPATPDEYTKAAVPAVR